MNNVEKQLEVLYNLSTAEKDSGFARAFGIRNNGEGEYNSSLIMSSNDIYMMLEDINLDKRQDSYDYVTFVTTGWAAPLNENGEIDGRPSDHNQRRRVTLVACLDINDKKVLGSVIKFDDDENLVFDEGTATGMLNDAILSLVK